MSDITVPRQGSLKSLLDGAVHKTTEMLKMCVERQRNRREYNRPEEQKHDILK